VLCNGNYLYDFVQERGYLHTFMDPADVRELLDFLSECYPAVLVRGTMKDASYFDRVPSEGEQQFLRACDPDACVIEADLRAWNINECHKILIKHEEKRRDVSALLAAIKAHFGDRFCYTSASPYSLEIQSVGMSKALGIEKLRGFSPVTAARTVIACGDYLNDLEMLAAADIAVCPENACEQAKALADLVLCHNDLGVIANIIEAIEDGRIRGKTV
jgi:hydroxymethylpyrimidine pyrophosphatase-like HAD family hydrolase